VSVLKLVAFALLQFFCLSVSLALAKDNDQSLWQQLRSGGHVVLIRHADAPGTYDPPGFRLGDCATQRNLSVKGREQAKKIGQTMAEQKVPIGTVLSSQWCRCLDTATLAFGASKVRKSVELSSPTNLSATQRDANAKMMRLSILALRDEAASSSPNRSNVVYVTHNFNIQDILGVSADEGELIIVRADGNKPGELLIVGRIRIEAL
jgi:phosphohistidine phosphatase SixA